MVGRRSDCSPLERSLIIDAGIQLAVAGGSKALAKEFGLSSVSHRVSFEFLSEKGLPVAPLAALFPEVLWNNFVLIDQKFARAPMAPKRALAR